MSDRGGALPLSACFLHFGTALADFELWIAFANHIDPPASLDDLAIRVAVLQSANTANNFHRIDLLSFIVYVVILLSGRREYSVFPGSINGKLPPHSSVKVEKCHESPTLTVSVESAET